MYLRSGTLEPTRRDERENERGINKFGSIFLRRLAVAGLTRGHRHSPLASPCLSVLQLGAPLTPLHAWDGLLPFRRCALLE
jgi:hypothetical protein